MRRTWLVARREYVQRVKTWSFWLGTLLFPVVMVGLVGVSLLMTTATTPKQRALAVADGTGELYAGIAERLAEQKLKDGRPRWTLEQVTYEEPEALRKSLAERLADGELYGLLVIGPEPDEAEALRLYGRNVSDVMSVARIQREVSNAVRERRLRLAEVDLSREELDRLTKRVEIKSYRTGEDGEAEASSFEQAYFGTFLFVMVLYMALVLNGVTMMRGILEEKSNRVMEVLLGSLTPTELMSGKILGIGAVGLTQIAVYGITGGALRFTAMEQQMPAELEGVLNIFSLGILGAFLLYFLLGYLMFSALFAAVGAVCTTEQEAQSLQGPVIMVLVLPMVSVFYFVTQPDSTASVVASLIPVFTPMVMFMRISVLTPPLWQILLSVVLCGITIALLFRAVGKIFRIGVLMYGKRPSLKEIWKWARA